jgi:hypothetical protein
MGPGVHVGDLQALVGQRVPASVLGWTVREIGVGAATTLAGYGDGEARWEHQAEIRRAYGYRPFGDEGAEDELALWLRARAWISAESHRVLFMRAVEHLTARRILLPGYSTLWRLVGSACEHADARGFALLADTLTGEQRDRLAGLLHTPAGRRVSVLERLRRPEVEPTIGGLVNGLGRVQELRELADGLGGLDALPVARLRALMVDAERCRAADIAKMSDARRTATLMAFAITATERGQDDALELFDRLHWRAAAARPRAKPTRAPRRRRSARRRGPHAHGCLPHRPRRRGPRTGPRCRVRGCGARRARRRRQRNGTPRQVA